MEENKTSTWEEYRKRTHVIGRVVSAVTLVMLFVLFFLSFFSEEIECDHCCDQNNEDDQKNDGNCTHLRIPLYIYLFRNRLHYANNILALFRQKGN